MPTSRTTEENIRKPRVDRKRIANDIRDFFVRVRNVQAGGGNA
jgi:hypothetical protein